MKVNQISFGKIVKVNTPYEIAKQIEDIANGKKKSGSAQLNKEIKTLFSDISQGDAYTFKYDKMTSFIFSGIDGQQYWNSCTESIDKIRKVKEDIVNIEQREARTRAIWDAHLNYVYNLINTKGIYRTLDPAISKNNKVKALNIFG